MPSCPGAATGPRGGCCAVSGTSISMARRRWRWSKAANALTSSTSGTNSPPIRSTECFEFAADPKHSVPEKDRRFYAKQYAQPGGMRAGFEVFRAFEQDGKDFAAFAQTRLTMPMLVLSGEKAGGQFLIDQGRMVDDSVEGVIVQGSGHWLIDEAPEQVIP